MITTDEFVSRFSSVYSDGIFPDDGDISIVEASVVWLITYCDINGIRVQRIVGVDVDDPEAQLYISYSHAFSVLEVFTPYTVPPSTGEYPEFEISATTGDTIDTLSFVDTENYYVEYTGDEGGWHSQAPEWMNPLIQSIQEYRQ